MSQKIEGWSFEGRYALRMTGGKEMLWTILVVLLVLWLLGLIGGVGGGLIHLLLVVAVIVLIFQLLSGRRTVV
jgi:hypothetical protein